MAKNQKARRPTVERAQRTYANPEPGSLGRKVLKQWLALAVIAFVSIAVTWLWPDVDYLLDRIPSRHGPN